MKSTGDAKQLQLFSLLIDKMQLESSTALIQVIHICFRLLLKNHLSFDTSLSCSQRCDRALFAVAAGVAL